MEQVALSPDTLLTRERVAASLTAAGYPIATKTLATKATRGGGPPFSKFARRTLYRWGDALEWARSHTTPPARSTAEAGTRKLSMEGWENAGAA